MRGNKILAIIWILIALLLSVVLFAKLTNRSLRNHNTVNVNTELDIGGIHISKFSKSFSAELQDTLTFDASDIQNFDITLSSESLYIQTGSGNKVTVELYCPTDLLPSVKLERNTLRIDSAPVKVRINTSGCKTVVTIPSKMDISKANLNVSSGSIHLDGLEGTNLNAHASSGSVHADNCDFDTFKTQSSSGSVHVNNCTAEDAEIHSSSGSVHIDNCTFDKLKGTASSGSVNANGEFEQINLSSSSGSVRADLRKELKYDSSMQSTSGSIHLNIPSKSAFTVRYNTTSGTYRNSITDCRGKRGTDVVHGGGIELDLRTTSGSISIN